MTTREVREPLFDPFGLAAKGVDPYRVYRELRESAPVYRNAERGFWALSRFDDIRAASRDWAGFSNAEGVDLDELGSLVFGPGDFLDMDPPEHDELRAVVKGRFTPKSVALLEPMVESAVERLLDRIEDAKEFDGMNDLAWPLPIGVMCALFGCSPEESAELGGLYRRVMERRPGEVQIPPEALVAARELRARLVDMAAERRGRPRADVMTDVGLAQIDGEPLPDAKLAGMAFVLFSAGIDTVASLLGNALWLLAEHGDQRKALAADPSLVPAAIEEILRYESPLQFNARTTTRPIEIVGTTIPPRETVLLLYGSANRDNRRFDDADRFDPGREPKRHLAFGEGIHFCIGAPLARLQARVALTEILRRTPNWELAGEVTRQPTYNMRTLATLPLAA